MQTPIDLLVRLNAYFQANLPEWQDAKALALQENAWFTEEYIDLAVQAICEQFLDPEKLKTWLNTYAKVQKPKVVGLVMAGNIPLVGFHDFVCVLCSGHHAQIKLSTKDKALMTHIVQKLNQWDAPTTTTISLVDKLKDCDAYIATGSNNSARYFEYYFGKKPSIIRRNRTSVAFLDGTETEDQLMALSEDVFTYFGLGCRNVSQVWVPQDYKFDQLLDVFSRYDTMLLNHKYKNNYDYYTAIYLLNQVQFLTNGSLILVENANPSTGVSVLNYQRYETKETALLHLKSSDDIQTIVGKGFTPFGTSQAPALNDYADGVDTMQFLTSL